VRAVKGTGVGEEARRVFTMLKERMAVQRRRERKVADGRKLKRFGRTRVKIYLYCTNISTMVLN
jgi:hypothetical protein